MRVYVAIIGTLVLIGTIMLGSYMIGYRRGSYNPNWDAFAMTMDLQNAEVVIESEYCDAIWVYPLKDKEVEVIRNGKD